MIECKKQIKKREKCNEKTCAVLLCFWHFVKMNGVVSYARDERNKKKYPYYC